MEDKELDELLKSMGPLSEEARRMIDDMDDDSRKRDEYLKSLFNN